MKRIDHIINANIKNLLFERVSSVIYHFTNVNSLWNILKTNKIYLSSALEKLADDIDKRKFFLSLTRQRNGELGYSKGHRVRIALNGDKLNTRFKGRSYDYWGTSMGKQYNYQKLKKGDKIDPHQLSTENEDRILFDKPYINNFRQYINRIDILYDGKWENELPYIKQILKSFSQLGIIFVYDNKKDFNYQTDNIINQKILDDDDILGISNKVHIAPNYDLSKIVDFIITYENGNVKDKKSLIAKLLRTYGLDEHIARTLKGFANQGMFYRVDDVDFHMELRDIHRRDVDGDVWVKVSQMISDFFKRNNLKNQNEAKKQLGVKILKQYKKPSYDWDKTIKCLFFDRGIILHPDKTSFWDVVPQATRKFFVQDVMTNIRSHKSQDDIKFEKYLQHLVKNNVPVNQMITILQKLDVDESVLDMILGYNQFEWKNVSYNDAYKYRIIDGSVEDLEKMFEINNND